MSLAGQGIKPNQKTVGKSGEQKRLRATSKGEVYVGVVKSEKPSLSKDKEDKAGGNMQIMLQIAPIDGEGKTRFNTVPLFVKIPQPTPVQVFAAFNESATTKDGEPRGEEVSDYAEKEAYEYLRATGREEIAQPLPKFNKDAKIWEDQITDATYANNEEKQDRYSELMGPVHEFMLDGFLKLTDSLEEGADKAEVFKGDKVAFTLSYGKDGKGFPNVKIISGTDNVPAEFSTIEDITAALEPAV